MMNNSLPNEEWKKNFRLSRTKFFKLLDEQRPYITPKPNSPNYRSLPAQKKLAITLYYFKDTCSLRMTANYIGIHVSTASKTIHQVCKAITQFLAPKYLKLPKTQSKMQEKISEFEVMFGMSQAFGCIDGTHVPILRPVDNSQDYFCYKMFLSLNVQAVCDSRGRFMDVDCRWPGSVHDSSRYRPFHRHHYIFYHIKSSLHFLSHKMSILHVRQIIVYPGKFGHAQNDESISWKTEFPE
jgi:hypothetical protein